MVLSRKLVLTDWCPRLFRLANVSTHQKARSPFVSVLRNRRFRSDIADWFVTSFVGHIASLLVRFSLANKNVLPYGWSPRILVQCGVPYAEVWDVFHEMYESQVSKTLSVSFYNLFVLRCVSSRYHHSMNKQMSKLSHLILRCFSRTGWTMSSDRNLLPLVASSLFIGSTRLWNSI